MSETPVVDKPIREGHGVVETTRKLARIVEIDDVVVHPNADRMELAIVGGWQLCVKKGEFVKGQRAVYCEIDSLLPLSNVELFGFLEERRSDNRRVDGVNYHRLKTIKLRKELSQGLLVPVPAKFKDSPVETNLTLELGILKYEPKPVKERDGDDATRGTSVLSRAIRLLIGDLAGGLMPWPSFLPKSDQDRIQNKTVALTLAIQNGETFEVTFKLDGSSMTVFHFIDEKGKLRQGVCSRNYELPMGEARPWSLLDKVRYWSAQFLLRNRNMIKRYRELQPDGSFKTGKRFTGIRFPEWVSQAPTQENNFTRRVKEDEILEKLKAYYVKTGQRISLQGELIGPDIQSNFENVEKHEYYIYNVYRQEVDGQAVVEVLPDEARVIVAQLGLKYIPVLHTEWTTQEGTTVKEILAMAEGPAAFNKAKGNYREGLVFKCRSRVSSWKSISTKYLLKKAEEEDREAE